MTIIDTVIIFVFVWAFGRAEYAKGYKDSFIEQNEYQAQIETDNEGMYRLLTMIALIAFFAYQYFKYDV